MSHPNFQSMYTSALNRYSSWEKTSPRLIQKDFGLTFAAAHILFEKIKAHYLEESFSCKI